MPLKRGQNGVRKILIKIRFWLSYGQRDGYSQGNYRVFHDSSNAQYTWTRLSKNNRGSFYNPFASSYSFIHCEYSLNIHRHTLSYCASLYCTLQIVHFLQIVGLWQPWVEQVYWCHFFQQHLLTSCLCVTFWQVWQYFKLFHCYIC